MTLSRWARAGLKTRDSMTAIIRTYTTNGFVVGADRKKTSMDGRDEYECQKIFPVRFPMAAAACSFAGSVVFSIDNQIIDVSQKIVDTIGLLFDTPCLGLKDYALKLSEPVFDALKDAPFCVSDPVESDGGSHILTIFLDGYFDEHPVWCNSRIFHRRGVLQRPDINSVEPPADAQEAYGSRLIADMLLEHGSHPVVSEYKDTPFCAKYRCPYIHGMTVQDGVERSIKYIDACSDPDARAIDPNCANIGGRPMIAKVTIGSDFQWVPGYGPDPPA